MTKQKIFEISIAVGLVFSVLLSFTGFDARCTEIKQSTFRLHILANSDSVADQALKIKVRNKILSVSNGLFNSAQSKEQAIKLAKDNIKMFLKEAQITVKSCGYSYKVSGKICKCYFNTRVYENFTLPAGEYDALRIIIGTGKGHNWWCVLFPKVCVSAAADFSETLTPEAEKIVTSPQKYKVRFKVVEVYESAREKFNSWFN